MSSTLPSFFLSLNSCMLGKRLVSSFIRTYSSKPTSKAVNLKSTPSSLFWRSPPPHLPMSTSSSAPLVHSPPTSPSAAPSEAKKPRLEDPPAPTPVVMETAPAPTPALLPSGKQPKGKKSRDRKAKKGKRLLPDEAVMMDVEVFLGKQVVDEAVEKELDWEVPAGLKEGDVVELRVGEKVGSGGDGLSLYTSTEEPPRSWAILTPFALPNELIKVRIRQASRLFSKSDLVEVVERNDELRLVDEEIRCKYFGKCGGCQYQNISYDTQLLWKRDTVTNAFAHFSKLNPTLIPSVLPTIPSPKTYGYRTKITPHFSSLPAPIRKAVLKAANIPLPKKHAKAVIPTASSQPSSKPVAEDEDSEMADANGEEVAPPAEVGEDIDGADDMAGVEQVDVVVPLGGAPGGGRGDGNRFFPRSNGEKGRDGEEGDYEFKIGFDERGGRSVMDIEECVLATPVINKHYTQERLTTAANIALFPRNSTLLLRDSADPRSFEEGSEIGQDESSNVCVTDHKATMHERVGPFHFTFPAGSFFQNNNSILIPLTTYVRDAIFPPPTTSLPVTSFPPPTHLVDTYCGSGLFAITLSQHFEVVTGVEIDPKSIAYARANARLNGVEEKCSFKAGKSEEIFAGVGAFPWEKTAVVIDPPRKGCDEPFLRQLIDFHPQTVVYVSCNVHTQARDIGYLLSNPLKDGRKYVLESLRGFDLFPQTAHVEGVAVLRLVEGEVVLV